MTIILFHTSNNMAGGYYKRHTYEKPKKFTVRILRKCWLGRTLRLIVIGMSYLMLFATGSMQTQNDKMLLGDMNRTNQTTPDQVGQSSR